MHEQGIARDLVKKALEEAAADGSCQISGLNILLGPMGFAAKNSLESALRQAMLGTEAEGAHVNVKETGDGGIVLESIEVEEVI